MSNIGYIRVSTAHQNPARQLREIELDKIFVDKVSGRDMNREGLRNCLNYLRKGDSLYIHSVDRLSRNSLDQQKIVKDLVEKDIILNFVTEGIAFDSNKKDFSINKFLVNVLGAVAELEDDMMRKSQAEGIKLARKRGAYKGRIPTLDRKPILNAVDSGMRKCEIKKKYRISNSYLHKIINDAKANVKNFKS